MCLAALDKDELVRQVPKFAQPAWVVFVGPLALRSYQARIYSSNRPGRSIQHFSRHLLQRDSRGGAEGLAKSNRWQGGVGTIC